MQGPWLRQSGVVRGQLGRLTERLWVHISAGMVSCSPLMRWDCTTCNMHDWKYPDNMTPFLIWICLCWNSFYLWLCINRLGISRCSIKLRHFVLNQRSWVIQKLKRRLHPCQITAETIVCCPQFGKSVNLHCMLQTIIFPSPSLSVFHLASHSLAPCFLSMCVCVCVCVYIYVCVRERERERERERDYSILCSVPSVVSGAKHEPVGLWDLIEIVFWQIRI